MIKHKEQKKIEEDDEVETDENCYQCKQDNDMYLLLLCSKCNYYCCHTFCNEPFLDKIPDGDWFCKFCLEKEKKDIPLVNNYVLRNRKNLENLDNYKKNTLLKSQGDIIEKENNKNCLEKENFLLRSASKKKHKSFMNSQIPGKISKFY